MVPLMLRGEAAIEREARFVVVEHAGDAVAGGSDAEPRRHGRLGQEPGPLEGGGGLV